MGKNSGYNRNGVCKYVRAMECLFTVTFLGKFDFQLLQTHINSRNFMISILKQTSQFSDNFGFVKTGRCEKTIISSALMKNENHWPYQMCAHGQSSVHVKGLR